MAKGFGKGFQNAEVGYDDIPVTQTPATNANASSSYLQDLSWMDKKAQPGANTPLTETDPNTEYLRRLAGKGYGTPADNTDNAAYLDRLKTQGYGSGSKNPQFDTPNESGFMNMVNDFIYEATKQVFVYPEDLGSNPELLNWIQIEMYETGGYGIQSQQKDSTIDIMGVDVAKNQNTEKLKSALNSNRGQLVTNIVGAATIGYGPTQIITSGIAAKGAKALWNNFSYEPQFGTQEFGFVQETSGFITANKRVNKTICLYMPSSLKTSYGVEYNEEDFSALAQTASAVKKIAQTVSTAIKGTPQNETSAALMKGITEVAGRQALVGANKMLSSLATPLSGGEDLKLDKAYNVISRQVVNPFIINMYKSTKRRVFDFTFRFLPRNRQELLSVYNIITNLKKYALPKRAGDKAGRLIEYPAEFKIRFYHNGVENLFLPKIARCALKDVSLVYGDEPFTTFAPEAGFGAAPTKIDMNLSFEELEILTQDRVDQGY